MLCTCPEQLTAKASKQVSVEHGAQLRHGHEGLGFAAFTCRGLGPVVVCPELKEERHRQFKATKSWDVAFGDSQLGTKGNVGSDRCFHTGLSI